MTSPYGALSDELEGLIERVAKATGPDREIDLALATALVPDVLVLRQRDDDSGADPYTHWRYTEKIDDALALVERMLPGHEWGRVPYGEVTLYYPDPRTAIMRRVASAVAATPSLAIISALLAALRSLQTGNAE